MLPSSLQHHLVIAAAIVILKPQRLTVACTSATKTPFTHITLRGLARPLVGDITPLGRQALPSSRADPGFLLSLLQPPCSAPLLGLGWLGTLTLELSWSSIGALLPRIATSVTIQFHALLYQNSPKIQVISRNTV